MDINLKLEEGLTKEQVIQTYVDRYGEKVLSAPTKKGFNLVAWITPFFAIMVGGFGIRHVILKWVSMRKKEKQSEAIQQKDHFKNEKYSDQLEKELKKFD
jgi:cytochrome c-type biogenesis protein CcmH